MTTGASAQSVLAAIASLVLMALPWPGLWMALIWIPASVDSAVGAMIELL
jgi:hypothetical protein